MLAGTFGRPDEVTAHVASEITVSFEHAGVVERFSVGSGILASLDVAASLP
jgi:hypothetical protein